MGGQSHIGLHICSIFGILFIALILWFIYVTKGFIPSSKLWNEKFEFRRDADFVLQTSGHLGWTGLNWQVDLQGEFPRDRHKVILDLAGNKGKHADINQAIGNVDKVHYSILKKRIESNIGKISDPLQRSDFDSLTTREAYYIGKQIHNFVILSIKVVGIVESHNQCSAKEPTLLNYTNQFKYSGDISAIIRTPCCNTGRIQLKKSFYLTKFTQPAISNFDPMLIVIPRVNSLKCTGWFCLCPSIPPPEEMCFWFAHTVGDTGHRFIPKSIVSILFCY